MLNDSADPTAEAQWAFALRFYALPGVGPACVLLQDRLGLDVTVLLHALYALSQGVVLDDTALAAADALVAPWRAQVVQPLRALRRQMKPGVDGVPPAWVSDTRALVQQAELNAERAALALLAATLLPAGVGQHSALRPLLMRVVRGYAVRSHSLAALGGADVRTALATLLWQARRQRR